MTLRLCGNQNAYLTGSLQKSRRPQSAQKSRTLLRLCFAKLLVLLVGGPDDFVAGASRAHPPRRLRGGRIVLVGQPDRLRRQANAAIHNRSFACGTIPQTTEVNISRLEMKVVIVVLLSLYVIASFSIKEPSQFLYWRKCLAKILRHFIGGLVRRYTHRLHAHGTSTDQVSAITSYPYTTPLSMLAVSFSTCYNILLQMPVKIVVAPGSLAYS